MTARQLMTRLAELEAEKQRLMLEHFESLVNEAFTILDQLNAHSDVKWTLRRGQVNAVRPR